MTDEVTIRLKQRFVAVMLAAAAGIPALAADTAYPARPEHDRKGMLDF